MHVYEVRPRKAAAAWSKPLRVRPAIAVHLVIPFSGTGRVRYPPDGRGTKYDAVTMRLMPPATRDVLQQVPNLNV
jgi:hypothetical protein